MYKLRLLRDLDCISIMLYMPGMGGTFLSNVFNLADSAFNKQRLRPQFSELMLRPVGLFNEHEEIPEIARSRVFWQFLHSGCDAEDMALFLHDCEIGLLASDAELGTEQGRFDWVSGRDWPGHQTVYVPMHEPGLYNGDYAARTIAHVSELAADQGCRLRVLMLPITETPHIDWLQKRIASFWQAPGSGFYKRLDAYLAVQELPSVIALPMDAYLSGDIDSMLQSMSSSVIGTMENHNLVRSRLEDFYSRKVQPYTD